MQIRPAIKQDVPQIIKLISDVRAEYDCVLDVETEERGLLAPDDYFHQKNGEFWVAEENAEIIATVAVMINDAKVAELKYLYVNQNHRKKGLGEKLIKLALEFAKTKSAKEMILWSDTRFTKAHRLYEKLWFEKFGERELNDINHSKEYGFRKSLMTIAVTTFAEAVKDFKEFLAQGNLPTDILWVFLEDVYSLNVNFFGKDLWIKLPLPDENEKSAEKQYKIGQEKNLGICLTAFALCENKICCHLMIPKDDLDSQYMLMSQEYAKFTYTIDMPTAQAVKNSFRWKLFGILPFKFKQGNYSEHLQSKRDLQF